LGDDFASDLGGRRESDACGFGGSADACGEPEGADTAGHFDFGDGEAEGGELLELIKAEARLDECDHIGLAHAIGDHFLDLIGSEGGAHNFFGGDVGGGVPGEDADDEDDDGKDDSFDARGHADGVVGDLGSDSDSDSEPDIGLR
jgi:hypothetical protein